MRTFTPSAALTVAVSAAVALLGGEGLIRLILPPLARVEVREDSGAAERRRLENRAEQPGLYVHTPVGLRLRASKVANVENHSFSHLSFEVRTNSLGYRNREIGAKTRRRVLFLGDSITMAGYMAEDGTFVRRVETLSEKTAQPYETINAGVGGVAIADELAILLETGLSTEPDVVVVCFYLNDAIPSPAVVLLPPPTWLERSRLYAYLSLAMASFRDAKGDEVVLEEPPDLDGWREQVRRDYPGGPGDIRSDRRAFNLAIQKDFRDWGSAWSEGAWRRIEPVLRELDRQAAIHRFALRIVCFPLRFQVEAAYVADEPQRRLERIAAELGVPFLDLLPALREAHARGVEPLFFDQCHPTPSGHEIVAREILRHLQQLDAEP